MPPKPASRLNAAARPFVLSRAVSPSSESGSSPDLASFFSYTDRTTLGNLGEDASDEKDADEGEGEAEDTTPDAKFEVAPFKNLVWISPAEELKVRYSAIRTQGAHLGLDKSPFFPKSPSDYLAIRQATLRVELRRLKGGLSSRQTELRRKRETSGTAISTWIPVGRIDSISRAAGTLSEATTATEISFLAPSISKSGNSNLTSATNEAALPKPNFGKNNILPRGNTTTGAMNSSPPFASSPLGFGPPTTYGASGAKVNSRPLVLFAEHPFSAAAAVDPAAPTGPVNPTAVPFKPYV
ncbi:hypothetical protein QBC34DRAFT_72350 [Podospora aff. communis PSN243]|uniref:Uncharacterized protein n=1 Tax=Podospora aff. communis PSN243 TaxID=3040156 RepID=A0AAV9H6G9_9PEZI|nr:hypothetical protein QBC34DRAFT_72350 [Podospora aff. communis PSN243]